MTRRFIVSRAESGRTVAALLTSHLHLSPEEIRELVRSRRVRIGGNLCIHPTWRATTGQALEVDVAKPSASPQRRQKKRGQRERAPDDGPHLKPIVRHVDEQLVVVDKPAGLTTMRH